MNTYYLVIINFEMSAKTSEQIHVMEKYWNWNKDKFIEIYL